jgi:predicted RNase H-like HicB family nuclease
MQYQVFVENPADRIFLASIVGLPNLTANGITEEEAIDRLKGILDDRFKHGKLVTIDLDRPNEESPDRNDPWLSNMGIFQDDPTFDDFLSEINIYRHKIDETEVHP